MFSVQGLNLTLNGATWILIAFSVVLLIIVLFVYRRTNPVVSNRIRYVLIILRMIGLLGVFFLIFEPIFEIKYDKKEKSTLAILVDSSASMALEDMEVKRDSVLSSVLNMPVFSDLEDKFRIVYYEFAATTSRTSSAELDSIRFLGDATDIRHSLERVAEELFEENLTGIILLTDGAYNLGGNPIRFAREVEVPLYTVGIGSNKDSRDIAIVRVSANKYAYLGIPSPVNVEIRSLGFPETRTTINLKRNGVIVDSKNLLVSESPSEDTVNLSLLSEQVGSQKYTVEVASVEGELTYLNNCKTFTVDILKNKIKILLISGSVNPDLGFLRRTLERNDNYDLTVMVEKGKGEFYSKISDLSGFDVIVLMDYPQTQSNPMMLSTLLQVLDKQDIPVVAFVGNNTSSAQLARFERFIPLRSFTVDKTEILQSIMLTEEGEMHPITNLPPDESGDQWNWIMLPPVFSRVRGSLLYPNSQIIALFSGISTRERRRDNEVEFPTIVVRYSEGRRSVVVLAHGLWRWSLMMAGIGNDGEFYDRLINNLIRWPTRSGQEERVIFSTNSQTYRIDQTVVLQAEVYDNNYQPVNEADVLVSIQSGVRLWEVPLKPTGNGHYLGEFNVNYPGDYSFEGKASTGGRDIGVDRGRFTVGQYDAELLETRAQIELLQTLANESGGKFFIQDSIESIHNSIKTSTFIIPRLVEIEIWNKALLLGIILTALVLEWFLRKRKGMV